MPEHREPTLGRVTMDSLGGYRLLRTVGVGSRAEVLLAHPVRPDAELEPAVIKLYGPAVSDESIVAEIEALSRAAGDHVVRLLDVASTPEGAPALILSRHAAGSLARLLADRGQLGAGEVITILAPLATALGRMHAAGVAHGSIGPGAVLFDTAGSPALGCFGRAALFAPGLHAAALEAEQSVLADILAFGSLAGALLDGAGAAGFAQRARTEAAPGAWLAAFAESLFDLAEPLPVDLRPRAEVDYVPFPSRAVPAMPPAALAPAAAPARDDLVSRAREALGRVRRPVWAVAGASLVALVIALVAVPQESTTATVRPSESATPVAAPAGPVTADDPVAAALALLETRDRCIRDLSVECLDDVGQRDSSALSADRELLTSVIDGAAAAVVIDADPAQVALVQRLGDSALVSLGPDSEPASVLLVKGEAGWRIRDYLEE
ncbi:MAG: hypothetical protein JWR04_1125 [Rhodoglobus sp.]|jgi:hypothetical protein|nr:hypothetical protein [Rhodoglobus sp.]